MLYNLLLHMLELLLQIRNRVLKLQLLQISLYLHNSHMFVLYNQLLYMLELPLFLRIYVLQLRYILLLRHMLYMYVPLCIPDHIQLLFQLLYLRPKRDFVLPLPNQLYLQLVLSLLQDYYHNLPKELLLLLFQLKLILLQDTDLFQSFHLHK